MDSLAHVLDVDGAFAMAKQMFRFPKEETDRCSDFVLSMGIRITLDDSSRSDLYLCVACALDFWLWLHVRLFFQTKKFSDPSATVVLFCRA